VRYLTSARRFSAIKRWWRNSTSLKVRNGGTESSTNSVSDVSRTSGRPPIFDKIFDKIEDADGVGIVGVSAPWSEVERVVRVERRGGFVEVGRVSSALGGNVCAKSLTRSIALSRRASLEIGWVSNKGVWGWEGLTKKGRVSQRGSPFQSTGPGH